MFPYKGIIRVLRCIMIALITFYAIFKRCADAPHIMCGALTPMVLSTKYIAICF